MLQDLDFLVLFLLETVSSFLSTPGLLITADTLVLNFAVRFSRSPFLFPLSFPHFFAEFSKLPTVIRASEHDMEPPCP